MAKARKRITVKQKRGKKRYTRRNKRGGQPTTQSIDNIQQQIVFVKQHSEEFREIGVNPEEFANMMHTILQYIEEHHNFPPFITKETDLGSVDILSDQLKLIKKEEEKDQKEGRDQEEGQEEETE